MRQRMVFSSKNPIYYAPKVRPGVGENAYIADYQLLKSHFGELLDKIGLNKLKEQYFKTYFGKDFKNLKSRRHPGN